MKQKYKLYFLLLAIVMMANDAFFTWVGTRIHFPMWRQFLLVIGLIILSSIMSQAGAKHPYIKMILSKYKTIFGFVVILSFLTLIFHYFNPARIGFAWYVYFSGIPYLIFPFLARRIGWSRSKLNFCFIILGTFLSLGIFTDFLSGGMFTSMFLLEVTQEGGAFEAGRFCFLSTAPTIFSIYYCLCLMCCLFEAQSTKSLILRYVLFGLAGFFIFGSLFCGSRQTLVALIVVFLAGIFGMLKRGGTSIVVIACVAVTAFFLFPTLQRYISANQGIEDRYNADAIREDKRNLTWKKGFQVCVSEVTPSRALIGDGVGQTAGKVAAGEEQSTHYENTFFARIIDIGWFLGIWSLIIPVSFIWKYRKRAAEKKYMYLAFCVAYLFICCVSPNGASGAVQLSLFITLGFFLEDARLEKYA